MIALLDATCPKCKKRFGWSGSLMNRPPCPKCGHTIPKEELEADQKELDKLEQELLERKRKRNA